MTSEPTPKIAMPRYDKINRPNPPTDSGLSSQMVVPMNVPKPLHNAWRAVKAAAALRDIAEERREWRFSVAAPLTVYCDLEHASVQIIRHSLPEVHLHSVLGASMAWMLKAEQDEAGVYWVARRRVLVGELAWGRFSVRLPHEARCILTLKACALELDDLNGTFDLSQLQALP